MTGIVWSVAQEAFTYTSTCSFLHCIKMLQRIPLLLTTIPFKKTNSCNNIERIQNWLYTCVVTPLSSQYKDVPCLVCSFWIIGIYLWLSKLASLENFHYNLCHYKVLLVVAHTMWHRSYIYMANKWVIILKDLG